MNNPVSTRLVWCPCSPWYVCVCVCAESCNKNTRTLHRNFTNRKLADTEQLVNPSPHRQGQVTQIFIYIHPLAFHRDRHKIYCRLRTSIFPARLHDKGSRSKNSTNGKKYSRNRSYRSTAVYRTNILHSVFLIRTLCR